MEELDARRIVAGLDVTDEGAAVGPGWGLLARRRRLLAIGERYAAFGEGAESKCRLWSFHRGQG